MELPYTTLSSKSAAILNNYVADPKCAPQALGQTFFILWFTDIFYLYSMPGFGIKIKLHRCKTYIGNTFGGQYVY